MAQIPLNHLTKNWKRKISRLIKIKINFFLWITKTKILVLNALKIYLNACFHCFQLNLKWALKFMKKSKCLACLIYLFTYSRITVLLIAPNHLLAIQFYFSYYYYLQSKKTSWINLYQPFMILLYMKQWKKMI